MAGLRVELVVGPSVVHDKAVGWGVDHDDVGHGRGAGLVVVAVAAWRTVAAGCSGALWNQCMMGCLEAGGTEEVDSVGSSEPKDQKDFDIIWVHSQDGLDIRGACPGASKPKTNQHHSSKPPKESQHSERKTAYLRF